ncbi:MAG TPA: hypothetical protein VLX92_04565 [Kofleriaceae bacterium]|nr:hypothetical protein [Kofleriaceae bacterium]
MVAIARTRSEPSAVERDGEHARWTFGMVAPRAWCAAGGREPWAVDAEILVAGASGRVGGELRFVQIEQRRIEDGAGNPIVEGGDHGIVQVVAFAIDEPGSIEHAFEVAAVRETRRHGCARAVRERHALAGRLVISLHPVLAEPDLVRVAIRIENLTSWGGRGAAYLAALESTQLVLGVTGGELVA